MSESVLRIAGESLSLSNAGLDVRHEAPNGKDYLSIDLWVGSEDLPEHFLAINGFTVAGCRGVSDLQGRSFVLDGRRQEDEPEGDTASGELMESVMGDSNIDPFMFESISLKFGDLRDAYISVEIAASVFSSDRSGILVEGLVIAKIRS